MFAAHLRDSHEMSAECEIVAARNTILNEVFFLSKKKNSFTIFTRLKKNLLLFLAQTARKRCS
jgi:hypothetical protein